jgi:hypothetical protein
MERNKKIVGLEGEVAALQKQIIVSTYRRVWTARSGRPVPNPPLRRSQSRTPQDGLSACEAKRPEVGEILKDLASLWKAASPEDCVVYASLAASGKRDDEDQRSAQPHAASVEDCSRNQKCDQYFCY